MPPDFATRLKDSECPDNSNLSDLPYGVLHDRVRHSNFTPVAATTAFHLTCSAVTKAANSAGVVGAATASCLA